MDLKDILFVCSSFFIVFLYVILELETPKIIISDNFLEYKKFRKSMKIHIEEIKEVYISFGRQKGEYLRTLIIDNGKDALKINLFVFSPEDINLLLKKIGKPELYKKRKTKIRNRKKTKNKKTDSLFKYLFAFGGIYFILASIFVFVCRGLKLNRYLGDVVIRIIIFMLVYLSVKIENKLPEIVIDFLFKIKLLIFVLFCFTMFFYYKFAV